jgi:hypothetical chaperone protein
MSACGLDFGTSNTTLGVMGGGAPALVALDQAHGTIPSAIFYEPNGAAVIGRKAIESYVDGLPGRLMRSLKSVLGTSLIEESTVVGGQRESFRNVIAYYLGAVKRRAEQAVGRELRSVVHGRPVHFVDNSADRDRKAEAVLLDIAQKVGFEHVTFQFEPIAASLDYEREVTREEIALIADIGGGTSDFSIVRLGPQRRNKADRSSDILANDGVRVGGTDFDRYLSLGVVMPLFGYRSKMTRAGVDAPSSFFFDLATWSTINRLYDQKAAVRIRQVRRDAMQPELFDRLLHVLSEQRGHTLAIDVESAKIALTDELQSTIDLGWVEQGLSAGVKRADLVRTTQALADRIGERIRRCLKQAGLPASKIDTVFLTGGSVQLAHVRKAIRDVVPSARLIDGDTFGAVGKGLTIEAARRYGPAEAPP